MMLEQQLTQKPIVIYSYVLYAEINQDFIALMMAHQLYHHMFISVAIHALISGCYVGCVLMTCNQVY